MPQHVLLVAIGSAGDVNPFLGIGRELRRRGHRVTLITSGYFARQVEAAGLELAPIGTAEEFLDFAKDPYLWRGSKGTKRVVEVALGEAIRPVYDLIAERFVPGETVVAASTLGLGARIAHEKLGVPMASVHLQPAILRSAYETPRLPGLPVHRLPRPLKRSAFWLIDAVADWLVGGRLNAVRHDLGLPPVRRFFAEWLHSPQLTLGLFPSWFASPQPDWPQQTRLTGFPLFDATEPEPLPPEVANFLETGEPPVVFTPGSANMHARPFFAAAGEAADALGRRGLLLTRFPEQLPSPLPPSVMHAPYVPLSVLLRRCAAVVHHAGIGTLSQGFAAGVPQLLMPMGHDQLDNAARAERLGVARVLPPRRFTPQRVRDALHALTTNPQVQTACARVRGLCTGSGVANAADAIEGLTFGGR